MAQPIVVASSRGPYEVIVEEGALPRLPAIVRAINPAGRAFAVAGAGVLAHHRERIESALGDARLIAIEDGEQAKTLASVETLFDALIESGA
ncbi:MAG TPA: hypothetical protein VFV54_04575, partial [Thermoanaerobaculia bacterium]|nr:hypothetical protein [Thermoanaerobaculia bacterium]